MTSDGLRRAISAQFKGAHWAAVIFMGPLAAAAILVLREFNLVAHSPLWLIPLLLVGGQFLTMVTGGLWGASPTRPRLHLWIASQSIVVTATIYATGWGPALAIGLVLVGQDTLARAGSTSERVILTWTMSCLAGGELLIALGWAPSLIPVPQVHGLAVLMAIGIAFSYRSLRSALVEREEAAALTLSRERRFRALVQSSSDLVFLTDSTGKVTYASPSCRRILGYEPEEMIGVESRDLVLPDDFEQLNTMFEEKLSQPRGSIEYTVRVRRADRSWCWLDILATNLLEDPDVRGTVINARDITERRARLERQSAISDLGREFLRARTLAESVDLATTVIGRVLHSGQDERTGTETGTDHLRPPVRIVLADSGDDEWEHRSEAIAPSTRVPVGNPDQPLGYIEVRDDIEPTSEDGTFMEDVANRLSSAIVRIQAEEAIRHQATHDPLTGLPNRALFNDRLNQSLKRLRRTSGFVAVMIADLDGFKNVNDSLGHLTGDALLVSVAERLTCHLRGFDTIARLGGDEFAILFDELEGPEHSGALANRVLEALVAPLPLSDREVAIGASVGIALTKSPSTGADRLLADADAAMYLAKREGKGCYRIFQTAMHTAAVERMNLEQELRAAIRDSGLMVHYQPIIDTQSGRVTSFEALARWNHMTRGFVPPDTFIPVAEEAGLIVDLGRMVLFEACQQARSWHELHTEARPHVSVNASRLQLANPEFTDHVSGALEAAGLEPGNLIIEVTESILATESRRIIDTLDELRRTGVRIAIDDFGTGYSSFAALAELPIDILKIDKRFVDRLLDDDQGRGFVNAIMQLAETLHLETTAEGVEEIRQREVLAELGCTNIQGYLFSRPLTGEKSHDYLALNASISARSFAFD